MKTIVVKWVKANEYSFYDIEMEVIHSDHKRFPVGSKFDYGFFDIATAEGYTIISLPLPL